MDARILIFGETSSPAGRSPWAFTRSSAQRNVGWKCFTDPVSNAIVADALLEQELVTDPQAAAHLDAIRQLDDVAYDTAFEPPVSDYELDGLDLER